MIGTRVCFGRPEVRPRVLISVPNQGWNHKVLTQTLLQIVMAELYHGRISGDIIMPTNNPLENNQHHIIADVLQRDYDFWVSIDADNPPRRNVVDLVFLDLDIVGCPTPVWHWTGEKPGERPIYWNAYDYVQADDAYREHEPKDGLQMVDAIGGGCFVVARRVLEQPVMQAGAFRRQLLPNGTVEKGNDISFCARARQCGFSVYAHYGYPCYHFREVELGEVIMATTGDL
jgi:hypothetical protein